MWHGPLPTSIAFVKCRLYPEPAIGRVKVSRPVEGVSLALTPALKTEAGPAAVLSGACWPFQQSLERGWESWVIPVQLGVDSQGSGERPVVSHFPPGTSSCFCLHLNLASATPVWCEGTPWISSSFLFSFSVGPTVDSCGGSRGLSLLGRKAGPGKRLAGPRDFYGL